jgi:hypothetical protein
MLERSFKRGRRPDQHDRPLHVCRWCGSDYASLVDWEEAGATHWRILLRCGECGVWCADTVDNKAAKALDRELDRATASIARDLALLDHERMAEQAEVFTHALERDLIDAADFVLSAGDGRR